MVSTSYGPISVTVCGDQDKPALVTYPDVGLNCKPPDLLIKTMSSLDMASDVPEAR